jgi:Protein of unknown function (DUF551)
MDNWQPIDTAPRDGTRILLYDRYEREQDFARFVGAWGDSPVGYWFAIPGAYRKRPTHWQPLPAPPKDL